MSEENKLQREIDRLRGLVELDGREMDRLRAIVEQDTRDWDRLRSDRASLLAVARAAWRYDQSKAGDPDFGHLCRELQAALAALSDEVKREMEKS